MLFFIKTIISGLIVAGASTLARKYPGPGGLLVALPVTTFLTLGWMGWEGVGRIELATFLQAVGWVTLAGVGFFFLTPLLIRQGWNLVSAFGAGFLVLGVGSWLANRYSA